MSKNIIIVILLLVLIYLGQQGYFGNIGASVYSKVYGYIISGYDQCRSFIQSHFFTKVTSEIEKRQNIAKEEIKDKTKEVTKSVWDKTKDYVSNFFGSIFNSATENK